MREIEQGEYFSKVRRYMRTHKNLTGAEYYGKFLQLWKKSNDCDNCEGKPDCDQYHKMFNTPITGNRLLQSCSSSRITEINFMAEAECIVVLNRDGIFCLCAESSQ